MIVSNTGVAIETMCSLSQCQFPSLPLLLQKRSPKPLSYFCFVFTKICATWNHTSPPGFQAQTLKLNVFKRKWKRQS